ncbi:MAG: 16S rRNA (uracil(1498)-N(3))-methyltransferase [Bdellovibrionales bacterium]
MHNEEIYKIWTYPRIYVDTPLNKGAVIDLSTAHAHYFKNVLRRQDGNFIRLFNGQNGEWIAKLENLSKKSGQAKLQSQSRKQPENHSKTTLYFAPIKKSRMDILIEKAVELGVDTLSPIITERTQNRHFKKERIQAQILEASEQCERLEIPMLSETLSLHDLPQEETIHACIERNDNQNETIHINKVKGNSLYFLVGPEGGFSDQEINVLLSKPNVTSITLGSRILRAETASIICLTHAEFLKQK